MNPSLSGLVHRTQVLYSPNYGLEILLWFTIIALQTNMIMLTTCTRYRVVMPNISWMPYRDCLMIVLWELLPVERA